MMNTELADRMVWFDGTISVKPNQILDFTGKVKSENLFVTELTDDIRQYNKMAVDKPIEVKSQMLPLNKKWNIPDEYRSLDVFDFVAKKFEQVAENDELSEEEFNDRLERLAIEYKHFKKRKLIPLLRTLIYVINTFEREKVVWGPGRGSSVSSYLLYVIGVHDVDSVFFGLNITDFLRDIE